MNKNIILGIAAFGGLLLIATILPDTPQNSDQVNQTVEQAEEDSTSIPSEIVTQFPIHPHVEVRNTRKSNKDGTEYVSFSLVAEATRSEINEWYREALSQNGWNIKSDKNVAGYQIIQAEKENLFTSLQTASGETSNTSIISQSVQIRP